LARVIIVPPLRSGWAPSAPVLDGADPALLLPPLLVVPDEPPHAATAAVTATAMALRTSERFT
jgi:hypothetical protein